MPVGADGTGLFAWWSRQRDRLALWAAGAPGDPAVSHEPNPVRRAVFVLTVLSNALNMVVILAYLTAFLQPGTSGWVSLLAQGILLLEVGLVWWWRRGGRQPVYFVLLLASSLSTFAFHWAANIAFGVVLGSAVLFQGVVLFVGVVLLDSRWFVALCVLVTSASLGLAGAVLLSHPADLEGALAVTAMLGSWMLGLMAVTTAVMLEHRRRAVERSSQALEDRNNHLTLEVELRTKTNIAQQERMFADAKMAAVGTLAGGVAHDFNNLLQGIQSNLDVLLALNPELSKSAEAEMMQECVQSGSELIRDLLGFGRATGYQLSALDVRDLIDRTVRLFSRTHKAVVVDIQFSDSPRAILGDRAQLQQVLINILTNASQAMGDRGEVTVAASLEQGALGARPALRVDVTDHGRGMDEETRKRVFEPFFTTKPMGRGSGLGLASAYGIVASHGGRIEVTSELGKGTTMTLLLPIAAAAEAPVQPQQEAEPASTGRGTILVVDDERVVREGTSATLTQLGYSVLTASSGPEAIDLYRCWADEVRLVLLDVVMPGMDGAEVYAKLKQLDPNVRVLLATGYAEPGVVERLVEAGCAGVLSKPYDKQQVARAVSRALEPTTVLS